MRIVFDTELMRPGCVLLQAAMGGSVPAQRFSALFDPDCWILAPTPSLRTYEITDGQLDVLAEKVKAPRKARKGK